MGYFRARRARQSLAIALSTSLQTGNGDESGAVSQRYSTEPGGEDVAHDVSVSETDREEGGTGFEQSLRARLQKDPRHDPDRLSKDSLARDEGEEVTEEEVVATFGKI